MTVMFPDYVGGWGFPYGARNAFKSKGGKIVQEQPVALGTIDYSPYLLKLEKADCLNFFMLNADSGRFIQQIHDYNVKIPLLSTKNSTCEQFNLEAASQYAEGMYSIAHYNPGIDTPANKEFVARYNAKFGRDPVEDDTMSYLALTMYIEAVKATGGDTSPDKINAAMKQIKVDLPWTSVSYTPDGSGIQNVIITKNVKVGDKMEWQVVKSYPQWVHLDPEEKP